MNIYDGFIQTEVKIWISNCIPHKSVDVITYTFLKFWSNPRNTGCIFHLTQSYSYHYMGSIDLNIQIHSRMIYNNVTFYTEFFQQWFNNMNWCLGARLQYLQYYCSFALNHRNYDYWCNLLLFAGAFLIPYVIMLAIVGLPIFYFELCFGQFSSLGPIKIWLISPLSKGRQRYIVKKIRISIPKLQ